MAGTFTVTISVNLRNPNDVSTGLYVHNFDPNVPSITQNNLAVDSGVIDVATSETTLVYVNVTTPGLLELQSLEPVGGNYVEYGDGGDYVPFGRLNPGEATVLRLSQTVLSLGFQAHAGNVKVAYTLFQD